jgi:hypothetical protein
VGFCEYGNEHPDSIKTGEFLDKLSNYKLFKNTLHHGFGPIRFIHRHSLHWVVVSNRH